MPFIAIFNSFFDLEHTDLGAPGDRLGRGALHEHLHGRSHPCVVRRDLLPQRRGVSEILNQRGYRVLPDEGERAKIEPLSKRNESIEINNRKSPSCVSNKYI